MSIYVYLPEEFTERRHLCRSRYRVERSEALVTFRREFWNGREWERSPFSDSIAVPACVAKELAEHLAAQPLPTTEEL